MHSDYNWKANNFFILQSLFLKTNNKAILFFYNHFLFFLIVNYVIKQYSIYQHYLSVYCIINIRIKNRNYNLVIIIRLFKQF